MNDQNNIIELKIKHLEMIECPAYRAAYGWGFVHHRPGGEETGPCCRIPGAWALFDGECPGPEEEQEGAEAPGPAQECDLRLRDRLGRWDYLCHDG